MIREATGILTSRGDLDPSVMEAVMREIMTGNATDAQISAFLTAMSMKGETAGEIAAAVRVIRDHSIRISPDVSGILVDTCGTGGDGADTFNISTAAAFVAAGAGVVVVKHGNRSASGRCGSADVLQELGIDLDIPFDRLTAIIEEEGIGFLYAPRHHPAMRYVAGVRREIGIRTIFNLIGPLANPAEASAQLLGVHSPALIDKMAEALDEIGVLRALVVHGDGLDEITTTGSTRITELGAGGLHSYTVEPEDFGLERRRIEDLRGGGPEENARIIREILLGNCCPARDIVLMNAGAAVYIGGRAGNLADGIRCAEDAIDSGAALEKLERMVAVTGEDP